LFYSTGPCCHCERNSQKCGKKSRWRNKASLNVNKLLFQILVWRVTISDWHLLLVCISFYSPQACLRESSRATLWLSHTYGCWNTLFGHATPQQQEDSYFLLTFKTSARGKDWHQRVMSNINRCLQFYPNVHQPTQQKPNLSAKSYKIQIFFKSIF
jgi:hypothetical protein